MTHYDVLSRRPWRPLIMGRKGAVASNHPAATQAGLDALRAGGTAADAAVAVSLALGVAEPFMSGLGGDGFYHFYDAGTGVSTVFNGSGTAPALAPPEEYRDGMPNSGHRSAGVPGSLAGVAQLHGRHGELPWAELVRPAAALAAEGVGVTHTYRRMANTMKSVLLRDAAASAIYLVDGELPALGAILVQPALARTLEMVAEGGAEAFYRGPIAAMVAAASEAGGGLIREADIQAFEPEVQAAISARYRSYEVRQTPPNSTGFVLLQELLIAEAFDIKAMGYLSAEHIHTLVEAKKLAFLDRERLAGDPRFGAGDLSEILDPANARKLAARIDPRRAASIPLQLPAPNEGETTYFCIVDAWGNAVSAIQSLNSAFGSGVTAGEAGFLLNNRMATWHLEPHHPNVLAPGKRARHTMNAPLILKDGKLWGILGTPGADNQVQVNFQAVSALIDFGMDPQQIVEAPRWFSDQPGQSATWPHKGKDELTIEEDVGPEVLEKLRALGHTLVTQRPIHGTCSLECIRVLENGMRMAGSDPRRDGWAGAY
ncbi:gamma-glutamyltransferase [Rhodovarius crocodyli]|nr:gamma-glutamyltransferase [Rhodovarius crocodyli]